MRDSTEYHHLLKNITFRCYAELNDFLPRELRHKQFVHSLKTPVTLEEAIESLGIPFSEIDLVLVNGQPASRQQRLHENDFVSLYPTFETLDISGLKGANVSPLRVTRFILDTHLGKLAKYLRMLGFDSLYRNDFEDQEMIEIAAREKRIILTRDKLLLKSARITHGYYVRSTEKHHQLREVVQKFDLYSQFQSFTRCMTCNSELVPKKKEEIKHLLEPHTVEEFNEFFFCPSCRKVYWKGSHFRKMESFIRKLTYMKG
ncbi:MAG: Mut7-C RNAse domain-containing protein [Bacteroidales bacterium]